MSNNKKDNLYVRNIEAPIYVPQMKSKPDIKTLFDDSKYRKLVDEIDNSNIPEGEKEFLRLASTRHIKFNYDIIAEYYAHSNKDVQELMEKNALVIIDFDKAIENGYVKLSKNLMEIVGKNEK